MFPSRCGVSPGFAPAWAWLALAALTASQPARALEPAPLLSITSGPAQVRDIQANTGFEAARDGHPVAFGSVIRTGNAFVGSLRYADGTILAIKPHSILQVLSDGLRLHRGQAWIKVVKRGRGFTCVTPSAIASVRGTRFSVEVPSMARVFGRRLEREFFGGHHLGTGVVGPVVTLSIGLAVLGRLVEEAPGGRVPATVKVFEGRVLVSYPAQSGSIKKTWMVGAGEQVTTELGERSIKTALVAPDEAAPGPVPPATAPPPARGGPADPAGKRAIPGSPADGPSHPVQLMNEPYDVR